MQKTQTDQETIRLSKDTDVVVLHDAKPSILPSSGASNLLFHTEILSSAASHQSKDEIFAFSSVFLLYCRTLVTYR